MEKLNEHDVTKSMLSTIRKVILNEEVENESADEQVVSNDEGDEEELTSAELSEEQMNFRESVSPRVNFTGFKIYPKNKNVVFSGKFENMGGLEWQFTLEDSDGLYITTNNVPFNNDTIDTIKKLKGYYDNWADEWAEKLATEYHTGDGGGKEVQKSDVV